MLTRRVAALLLQIPFEGLTIYPQASLQKRLLRHWRTVPADRAMPPPLETTVTTAAGSWPCGFADPLLSPDGEQAAVSISSRAGAPFRIRSLPVSAIVSRGCTGGKPGGPDFAWLEDRRSGAHDRFMSASLIVAVAIIAFAAAFHLHWALGGRLGYSVSLPQRPDGTPVMAGRIGWWRPAAGAVAIGLSLLGALTLTAAGRLDLPLPTSAAKAVLILERRGLRSARARADAMDRLLQAHPLELRGARYDSRLYSPLFLLLGASLIAVALGH